MAGTRITNVQNSTKPPPLHPPQANVQLRIKSSQSSGERLSQSRSMVLQESDLPPKPMSRHRRNQSQHNVFTSEGKAAVLEPLVDVKAEHLHVAKICDCGKKQRKNWSWMWSVLTSEQLVFHKDRGAESSQRAAGKTDVVQLCGAVVQWTTEKSSRKNVFQITSSTGSEYLVQADAFSTASKWFDAIRKNISSSTEAKGALTLNRSNSLEILTRHGPASPNTKTRNPVHRRSINVFSSSRLKHSSSDSADRNGVKNRLKKFISRRPSMKTLQEKGLIKDRVFGCHLLTLCEREGNSVPRFVQVCVDAVEKRGLEVDGIYRVSGNLATIQKLRFMVDQEEALDLDRPQWEDVHVITGALKMFFRELPEPLFPFRFFQQFVEAIKIKEAAVKVQAVKKLLLELPKPNRDTMRLLFSHLHRVLAFSRKNLMSTQGLGIVFGPTLMWPELDTGNMAVNMVYQNQIVEFILIQNQELFDLGSK